MPFSPRCMLCLATALATGILSGGTAPVRDEAWQVEELLSRDIHRAGSASLMNRPKLPPALAQNPLAQGFAEVLWWRARGDEGKAQSSLVAALGLPPTGLGDLRDTSLRAALLLQGLEMGWTGSLSLIPGGTQSAWRSLAQAGWSAARQDCAGVAPRLVSLDTNHLGDVNIALLAAWSLERCGKEGEALAILNWAASRGEEDGTAPDPRLGLMAGEILLRRGDPDAAHSWCGEAADAGNELPRIRLRAGVCLATADAIRGVLPVARWTYIDARHRQLLEPALPQKERIAAGTAAVWTALNNQAEEGIQQALDILRAMDVFSLSGGDGQIVAALRALAAVEQSHLGEARQVLNGIPPFAGPLQEAVAACVEGRFRQRQLDSVAASAAWSHCGEAAALARSPELEATVLGARAAAAADDFDPYQARLLVMQALARWPRGGPLGAATPFADPVLPRRMVERALLASWSGELPTSQEAGRLVGEVETLRLALSGTMPSGEFDIPDQDRLERNLASQDAVLAMWLLGETKVFLWLIDPAGVDGRILPSPLELKLQIEAGAGSALEALAEAMARFPRGVQLFFIPDGFLWGTAWGTIPAVHSSGKGNEFLSSYSRPSVMPSLQQVVTPDETLGFRGRRGPRFLGLTPRGTGEDLAQTAGAGLAGFDSFRVMSGVTEERPEIIRRMRDGLTLLHIGLPLLSAGTNPESVEWALMPPPGEEWRPSALNVDETLGVHGAINLVTLASEGHRSLPDASLVRAAGQLVQHGISAALVFPQGGTPRNSLGIWRPFLERLAAGQTVDQALNGSTSGTSSIPQKMILVGNADARALEPPRAAWPFWVASGGGFLVLFVVFWRWLRSRRDPFAKEPPDEVIA